MNKYEEKEDLFRRDRDRVLSVSFEVVIHLIKALIAVSVPKTPEPHRIEILSKKSKNTVVN